jgi:hypothetical protein
MVLNCQLRSIGDLRAITEYLNETTHRLRPP